MKNAFYNSLFILAVGGLMIAGSAAAQTSTTNSGAGPGVVDPGHPRVNEVNSREQNQQQRIANGVNSGQLSPSETAHLERQQENINHHVAADREANGGKLTPQEKQNINRRQNNASKNIHEDKHNEKTAPR